MTFRVLGPHERGRFAPEAWGHLLALTGSGALNAAELEHVIERALLQIDGRIALDDLRSLMEGAGFGEQGEGYLRLSYANSVERLRAALDAMESVLPELVR